MGEVVAGGIQVQGHLLGHSKFKAGKCSASGKGGGIVTSFVAFSSLFHVIHSSVKRLAISQNTYPRSGGAPGKTLGRLLKAG